MDYYNDSADDSEMPPKSGEHDDKQEEHDPGDEKTAMLPKSVTGGKDFEVGDEIVLEVVAVHEDELQVKYSTEKGDKEEHDDGGEKEPSMARASEGNNSMAYMS